MGVAGTTEKSSLDLCTLCDAQPKNLGKATFKVAGCYNDNRIVEE